jgi:uncharacterized protein YndB with AHSA1/START domain
MSTTEGGTMTAASTDRIEKEVQLKAPRSRVWRALTTPAEFGEWFGVKLNGEFKPGAHVTGRMTFKGSEDFADLEMWIDRVEPERIFSYRWHPYGVSRDIDYSKEPKTLIVFTLEDVGTETRLTVVESGFDSIPASRRAEAFRMNTGGWKSQMEKLRKYVDS